MTVIISVISIYNKYLVSLYRRTRDVLKKCTLKIDDAVYIRTFSLFSSKDLSTLFLNLTDFKSRLKYFRFSSCYL